MAIGVDRFVRVMSGGLVVTDKLVQVRLGKVNASITLLEDRIGEVKKGGFTCPDLDKTDTDLKRDRDAATKLKDNKAKCEALEPVKGRAKQAAADAAPVVDKAKEAATATEDAGKPIKELQDNIAAIKKLGFVVTALENEASELVKKQTEAGKLTGIDERIKAVTELKQGAEEAARRAATLADSAKQATKATEDAVAAIKAFHDEAEKVKKIGLDTKQMDDDFNDLQELQTDAQKLTEIAARLKAEGPIKKRANDSLAHAKALSKACADSGATDKKKPDKDEQSKIYEAALKNLYGLEIDNPGGMTNTHFDRVFNMFGMVPQEHVGKGKLKKLLYDTDPNWAGGGAYNNALKRIRMGEFGIAQKSEKYQIGDTEIDANSFNVTTLHEIGHAVDGNNTVMDTHMGTAGCGDWNKETTAGVVAACLAEIKKLSGLTKTLDENAVTAAITKAVTERKVERPDDIKDDGDWTKIEKWLKDYAVAAQDQRYYKPSPIVIGTRAFTMDVDTEQWWSYGPDERKANGVNNYQWRTPAEWFAEIYAITWLAKKPPKGVAADIAKYMWGGKAA
jgi:chemotaxis protein histidine kinase CheA